MTPLRNAVGLVDHEHGDLGEELAVRHKALEGVGEQLHARARVFIGGGGGGGKKKTQWKNR